MACHTRTNLAVRVHTLPVCPNCSVLKKSLVEHGVSFKEHDLDSPQSHGQRVHRTTADNAPDLLFYVLAAVRFSAQIRMCDNGRIILRAAVSTRQRLAVKKEVIDTIGGKGVARLSNEERERRDDMLINERPGTVQTQRQEPATAEETGAEAIGGVSVPDKAPHAARTRTEIVATVSPQQQYVGKDVTITGRLTADAVGLPNLPINLYRLVAGFWTHSGATSTDSAGGFAFEIRQSSGGTSSFAVAYPGDATFEPSVSPEISVTYVTIPTALTE